MGKVLHPMAHLWPAEGGETSKQEAHSVPCRLGAGEKLLAELYLMGYRQSRGRPQQRRRLVRRGNGDRSNGVLERRVQAVRKGAVHRGRPRIA